MINVYLDPSSHVYLNNGLFKKDTIYNKDDWLSSARYLREYCLKKNINLNTIDFWDENKATGEDIYVSNEHKIFIRKAYWKFKNKNYPIVKLDKFKKRILFQFEAPVIMAEVYLNIKSLFKTYDKVFFSCKMDNPKSRYFHLPQTFNKIFPNYWKNSDRAFLTMINSNIKPRYWKRKPLNERVKAVEFFSKTNDIDLYGSGWDKRPLFPYWFYKKAIQKARRGPVKSKYLTLSKYNFSISFENGIFPGYFSEKIFDCFLVGTVPIYLGAPDIEKYVPKECFIDMRDFKNYDELKLFLKSLKKSEIQSYKENARKFLESEQYKPFTKEHFAKMFVDACLNK